MARIKEKVLEVISSLNRINLTFNFVSYHFDQLKFTYKENCLGCSKKTYDPMPFEQFIYLHAIRYKVRYYMLLNNNNNIIILFSLRNGHFKRKCLFGLKKHGNIRTFYKI